MEYPLILSEFAYKNAMDTQRKKEILGKTLDKILKGRDLPWYFLKFILSMKQLGT